MFTVVCALICILLFTQKKAYNMATCLEFRRVLFRSDLPEGEGPFPAMINVGAGGLPRGAERLKEEGIAIIYFNNDEIGAQPYGRSEERRVGNVVVDAGGW